MKWTKEELRRHGLDEDKNPDLRLEGQPADVYTPREDDLRSVVRGVNQKVEDRQVHRVVVNLAEVTVTRAQLKEALRLHADRDLKEVITIDRSGYIGHAFP